MKKYTLCFDNKIHISNDNVLSTDIRKHGGGSTDINLAFQKLDQYLLNEKKEVVVLFVSDGGHNCGGNIE